ncbi:MAG: FAD-dependent oxidoreductase [Deltaproteobacteria bacterium]
MKSEEVVILGCGVSGLTCGIRLLEEGFDVRIEASSLPPDTTSNVAAAYWYPYKVSPQDKVLKWAAASYRKFVELSLLPESGVSMFELLKIYDRKMPEPFWKSAVNSFRRAHSDLLPEGYIDGFLAEVPRIETPVYMQYLVNTFTSLGGTIRKLDKELDSISSLNGNRGLIVNCSGLGAGRLLGDEEVFPIRGQIVRVTNPGLTRCINDEMGPLAVSYIVPRSSDCILGGTAEEGDWSLEVDPETADSILRKCSMLEPALKETRVLEHRVGLRPGRTEVRLELEQSSDGRAFIHNYGHGGAGFTLSWGCAEEVLELAEGYILST